MKSIHSHRVFSLGLQWVLMKKIGTRQKNKGRPSTHLPGAFSLTKQELLGEGQETFFQGPDEASLFLRERLETLLSWTQL
jgi:hypothetical protein